MSDHHDDETSPISNEGNDDVASSSIKSGWSWRPRLAHALVGVLALALIGGAWIGAAASPDDGSSVDNVAVSRTEDVASRDHARPDPTPSESEKDEEETEAPELNDAEPAPEPEQGGPGSSGPTVVVGPECDSFSGHQATACGILAEYNFGTDQMQCLVPLWEHESGWNPNAANPSSGAYGIPQSLPGDKMASAGADWQTNAATQIRWGLSYIKGRYGDPCGAWGYWQGNGWY
ncbi:lytic transglycosylase domain-containing protein [Stackebrandtia soli]|uniref:aggregation-promoting factor C-terminal-like domain-containing protein n=1 Tax=Stackebrandtia soli TaxID=1892856 RepID=UPI0039EBBE5F